jgi:hypothetical protein
MKVRVHLRPRRPDAEFTIGIGIASYTLESTPLIERRMKVKLLDYVNSADEFS